MKEMRTTSALLILPSIVSILVSCAKAPQIPPPGYIVSIGNGGAYNTFGCGYESFQSWSKGHLDDGIYRLLDVQKGMENQRIYPHNRIGPEHADSLGGNFGGLGKRTIMDKTKNKIYHVEIIYHTSSDDALLARMRTLGCIQ
jgi:hypothetical protein